MVVNISNETMKDFEGSIQLKLCRNDFSVIEEKTVSVNVGCLTSCDVFSMKVVPEDKYSNYMVAVMQDKSGNTIMTQTELFVKPKHYEWKEPRIQTDFVQVEGGVDIVVSADCPAKGVELDFKNLDCVLSENFFDITSRKPKHVFAKTDYSAEELKHNLIIRSVYDIGISN